MNKLGRNIAFGISVGVLVWHSPSLIDEKRVEIIRIMDQLAIEKKVVLEPGEQCEITVSGKKGGLTAILACNGVEKFTHKKEVPEGAEYLTQIFEVSVKTNGALDSNGGCIVIQAAKSPYEKVGSLCKKSPGEIEDQEIIPIPPPKGKRIFA